MRQKKDISEPRSRKWKIENYGCILQGVFWEVPSIAPVDSTRPEEKKVHVQKVAYFKIEGATGFWKSKFTKIRKF